MTSRIWKSSMAGLWLAVPAVALIYARMWDQIPQRLATHFNSAGRPNGWMSPAGSLTFGLVFLTIVLGVGTVLLTRVRKPDASSWALLGLFYVIAGVFVYTEQATLNYNLHGTPIDFSAIVVPVPIAVLLLMSVFIASKRGTGLPVAPFVAEEVHASHMWGLVIVAPVAIVLAVTAVVPNTGVRLALGAVGLTTLGAAAMAWSGFNYIFTKSGLEIRTLGFRLRSIPKEDIRDYAIDSWSVAGGYGIRGIGDQRAYVWGNKGVRIKTSHGEVFLGHSEPDRIVRDLDLIKQFTH